jgi:cytidyltransferase-like protein
MKIVLVTGGFDPIHSGHIAYLEAAKQLGDKLVVGVNSDMWLARKKGRPFMSITERFAIIKNLRMVDHVFAFSDEDGTACDAIQKALNTYPDATIVFANGGDRNSCNIPEMEMEETERVNFIFGVGGEDKKNSSSWILEEWKHPKTDRAWGYYRVLHEVGKETKLKELTVNPKTCLSMQRHEMRSEFWFVAEGEATVYTLDASSDTDLIGDFSEHEHVWISREKWHMLCNETNKPLKLIEIQYGNKCVEEDIERK